MADLTSRQAAIYALDRIFDQLPEGDPDRNGYKMYPDYMTVRKYLYQMPSAQAEQRWIPCSEKLPDNEKRVLCTVQSGEHFSVVPCIFIQHTRRWLPEVYGNHDNVLAWMPLPEPWRGEEDDRKRV